MSKKKKHKPEALVQKQPPQSPMFVRVERTLEVTVPDDISLENLSTIYRLEGMRIGMETLMQLPVKFREAVINGTIPRQVDTIKFIGLFRRAIADGLQNIINQIDVIKSDLEKVVGFKAGLQSAEDLVPDTFIRIVRIPDAHDGGFYVELGSELNGKGETVQAALRNMITKIDAKEGIPVTSQPPSA